MLDTTTAGLPCKALKNWFLSLRLEAHTMLRPMLAERHRFCTLILPMLHIRLANGLRR